MLRIPKLRCMLVHYDINQVLAFNAAWVKMKDFQDALREQLFENLRTMLLNASAAHDVN